MNIWDTPRSNETTSPNIKKHVDPQGFFEKLNYKGLFNDLMQD